jgi:hypothetical protein
VEKLQRVFGKKEDFHDGFSNLYFAVAEQLRGINF